MPAADQIRLASQSDHYGTVSGFFAHTVPWPAKKPVTYSVVGPGWNCGGAWRDSLEPLSWKSPERTCMDTDLTYMKNISGQNGSEMCNPFRNDNQRGSNA